MRPPGSKTDFNIDMSVADKGKASSVHIDGRINPEITKAGWNIKGTSGDLTIEIDDLELESLGPLLAIAGIVLSAKGRLSVS